MKKITKICLALIMVILPTILLCACGSNGGNTSSGGGSNSGGQQTTGSLQELKDATVFTKNTSHKYDGSAKYIEFKIAKPNSKEYFTFTQSTDEFTVVYKNNINVGTARAVITATSKNPYYTGSATFDFTITQGSCTATSKADLLSYLNNNNYGEIEFTTLGNTLELDSNDILNIEKTLILRHCEIVNNGTINIGLNGRLFIKSTDMNDCILRNNGTINNGGNIVIGGRGYIYNYNKINNNNRLYIESHGSLYTNSVINKVTKDPAFATYYTRTSILDSNIHVTLTDSSPIYYTGREIQPDVMVKIGTSLLSNKNNREYTVEYFNNVNLGKASIVITANENSTSIYGTTTLYFDILPKKTTVNHINGLKTLLSDPNYTKIIAQGVYISKPITISNGVTVTFTGTTIINSKVTNNGTIINNNNFYLIKTIDNFGTVINNNNLYIVDRNSVTHNTINNNGTIYTNESLDNVGGTIKLRKQITLDDISADHTVFDYNGESQAPTYTFTGSNDALTFDTLYYYDEDIVDGKINYRYVPQTEAGKINVLIAFTIRSQAYYGEITTSYTINRSTLTPNDSTELINGIKNKNYSTIVLKENTNYTIDCTSNPLTLLNNTTLKIGNNANSTAVLHYKGEFSNNGTIINNGTLISDAVKNDDNYSFGNIINNGDIVNNGTMIFNENSTLYNSISTGTKYLRTDINNYSLRPTNGEQDYTYNGDKKPIMQLMNNTTIIPDTDYRYYYNNWGIGNVSIEIISNINSALIYGETTDYIFVKAGTCTVNCCDDLLNAVNDTNDQNENNYNTIIFGSDFEIAKHITIPSDITLDCRNYVPSTKAGYTLTLNGTIILETKLFGNAVLNKNYSGKVIAEVSTREKFNYFCGHVTPVDVIKLMADILDDTVKEITLDRETDRELTVDLNGYSIKKITINNGNATSKYCHNITFTSTASTGRIGVGSTTYGVVINRFLAPYTITFKNVDIYGTNGINYGGYEQLVKLDKTATIKNLANPD